MTALLVLGIIILLLVLLCLCPVSIEISFDDAMHAVARFLFFRFNLTAKKEEIEAPDQKEEEDEEKKEEPRAIPLSLRIKAFVKREGVSGLLSFLADLTRMLKDTTVSLLRHLQIKRFDLKMVIATPDAYDTAMLYGKACAIVSAAYTALFQQKRCKHKSASVLCDYTTEQSTIRFSAVFSIPAFFIIRAGLRLLVRGIPLLRRFLKPLKPDSSTKPISDS